MTYCFSVRFSRTFVSCFPNLSTKNILRFLRVLANILKKKLPNMVSDLINLILICQKILPIFTEET